MKVGKQPKFPQRFGLPLILSLLFIFWLSIKLLSACTAGSIALSFMVPQPEADYWLPLIEEFENKHQNIRIDLKNFENSFSRKPNDTNQLRSIHISAFKEELPSFDLIYLDSIWVVEFAKAGWLIDLSNKFSLEGLENEFLHSDVESGIYNGKLYSIPFRTNVGVLYYRKDLLDEAGYLPPETFEDLKQISQALQARQKVDWGYLWQGRHTEALSAMFVEVLKGYGGFWIEDGEVGLDRPEAIQAVEFLRDTLAKGISPPDLTSQEEEPTSDLFEEGKAAFMRNWPNVWVDAHGSESNVSGKIAIQPMVHAPGKSSGACMGGWSLGIAKASKYKQEALEAIEFFTSAAIQRQFTLGYESLPSRRKLFFEPKIVARYSHFPELLNAIDNYLVTRPRIPEYAQASCILQNHLSAALNADKKGYPSPQQAMKDAAAETRQLLTTGKFNCETTNVS
ncbi:hypothetical protein NIES593_21480 [Hydrococcus rivularis NIES-593]|uniref:ABC transporter substrate-binding protein n=1 Tax=Hydrococcus rivularis NIES-593 TaxID=1921803 RepID=A0A1U7H831_9CYAN|nr:ABC transporter substrate-binding protein [Hydrococcus rivularis]OKH18978.1 hypothetical protein NIES593_21480 [Hydrococcus rivularis NIES-593]